MLKLDLNSKKLLKGDVTKDQLISIMAKSNKVKMVTELISFAVVDKKDLTKNVLFNRYKIFEIAYYLDTKNLFIRDGEKQ